VGAEYLGDFYKGAIYIYEQAAPGNWTQEFFYELDDDDDPYENLGYRADLNGDGSIAVAGGCQYNKQQRQRRTIAFVA
jgi:hypothetical protein